jgi:hypothetical protein
MMRTQLQSLMAAASLLLLLPLTPPARADETPLTMDSYCELLRRVYALSEIEWKDRIVAAEQLRGDRTQLIERLGRITSEYRGHRAKLFQAFGTESGTFGKYANDNKESIQQHLEESPSLRNEIDGLRDCVQGLVDRFEALMASERNGGDK